MNLTKLGCKFSIFLAVKKIYCPTHSVINKWQKIHLPIFSFGKKCHWIKAIRLVDWRNLVVSVLGSNNCLEWRWKRAGNRRRMTWWSVHFLARPSDRRLLWTYAWSRLVVMLSVWFTRGISSCMTSAAWCTGKRWLHWMHSSTLHRTRFYNSRHSKCSACLCQHFKLYGSSPNINILQVISSL